MVAAFSSGKMPESDDGVRSLTHREFDVFQMIGEGKNTAQIADALRISTKTVDVHKMNIRTKLDLHEGTELTVYAVRWIEGQNRGTKP